MEDTEEDIGLEVLENIINMDGIKKNIQAQNIFHIGKQKRLVRISSSGLSISQDYSSISGMIRTKKRPILVPFQNIVSFKCSHSDMKIKENEKVPKSLRLNKFSFDVFKTGAKIFDQVPEPISAKKFGFVGSMPDCLTINYVQEEKEKGIMKLKKVTLLHSDSGVIEWWSTVIGEMVASMNKRPRHLLIFINPYGGKGRGKQLWEDKIHQVFKTAKIVCKVIVTEKANHALNLLQTMPLHGFDGVISVGGDGMFAEVFNGVLMRTAQDAKLDQNDKNTNFIKPDIRVGFIPGGSTDTVSMSLHGNNDPVTAALHIVLGDRIGVDVVSIHSKEKLERFAMTMVSYGYFGDLMKHSEGLRWLGKLRYDLSGVKTFLAHKAYEGTISYVSNGTPDTSLISDTCGEGCTTCEDTEGDSDAESKDVERETGNLVETKPDKQLISGKFLALTSATLTCSCRHTLPGMSPCAHRGDGATDLIIVHKTSHLNYFRYLFRTAFHTSHPFTLPQVQAVRVKQWQFEPLDEVGQNSSWNCDGEILDTPGISARTHKQLVQVFARGVYNKKFVNETKIPEEDNEDFFDPLPDY